MIVLHVSSTGSEDKYLRSLSMSSEYIFSTKLSVSAKCIYVNIYVCIVQVRQGVLSAMCKSWPV